MKDRNEFRREIQALQDEIGPESFAYDPDEFWMIRAPYETIQFYAMHRKLRNTAIALPLARGLHNGSHRKSTLTKNGKAYRLPYVIHCLLVCRMLVDLHLPLPKEEEDIVLAAALCHDMIEDIAFENGGWELVTKYHLDPRVYETVKQVSKRRDFTPEEEVEFFRGIQEHPFALLVKLSDRSNNVEDMYNMSAWKVHEYIGETERFFHPMAVYGMEHYPGLIGPLEILRDKILCLTQISQILVDRCEARTQELRRELEILQAENNRLREELQALFIG